MALRGNLKDFSLPDVFQLVQLSRKTGVLRIKSTDAEGSIWFREGEVFFAQSNWHRDPLGQRLVTTGRITPSALVKVLDIQKREPSNGRRLGQILVDEGYLTDKVLETFVQEQIQDTIFDLMRWDEGEFDFQLLPDVVDEDIGLSVSIENVVMEGSRRLEEWNRIKKKVPSTEMVFKMATAPGEGTFEISLKPSEWALLLLVDGTRSVAELATEMNKTDFEVARVIYGLFSAGLLEVPGDEEVERLRGERMQREDKLALLDASRRAKDEAAALEAIEIESRLLAESEERLRVEQTANSEAEEVATPELEPLPQLEPERESESEPKAQSDSELPHEVPEFLTVVSGSPSVEDMAVFEEMMEAVLEHPLPKPEPALASGHGEPVAETGIERELDTDRMPSPFAFEGPALLVTAIVMEVPGKGLASGVHPKA